MIAGGAMLGGAWLLNIPLSGVTTLALTPDATARPGDYFAWSFVPLVGPMVQMFQLGTQHWDIPVLAIIEAVEVVGLIVAIVGTVGEDVAVLEPVASLRIMPWSTAEGAGVTMSGTF